MLAILRPQRFWETHERVSTAGKMLLIDRAETKARRMLLTSEEMLVPRLIFPRKKDMPTALKKEGPRVATENQGTWFALRDGENSSLGASLARPTRGVGDEGW